MLPGKAYKPEDILQILQRRIWILLVPFAVISAAVATWVHFLPDQYRSETVVLVVPQRISEAYVRPTVTGRIEDRLQSLAQQIMSRTRLERIIQDFNLYADDRKTGIMEDVVEQMRRDITLGVVRGDAFRISYQGDNPRTVMRVAERLAALFIEENLRDREVLAEGTNQFLEAQLEDARRRLVEHEKKLEDYRRAHAGQLPSQLDSNLQVLQSAQMQVQAVTESINRDRDRQLALERQIADLEQQQDTGGGANVDSNASLRAAARGSQGSARRAPIAVEARPPRCPTHGQGGSRSGKTACGQCERGRSDAGVASPRGFDGARAADRRAPTGTGTAEESPDQEAVGRTEPSGHDFRLPGARRSHPDAGVGDDGTDARLPTLQGVYDRCWGRRKTRRFRPISRGARLASSSGSSIRPRLPERPFSPESQPSELDGHGWRARRRAWLSSRCSSTATTASRRMTRSCAVLALPVLAVVPMMQSAAEKRSGVAEAGAVARPSCSTTVVASCRRGRYTFRPLSHLRCTNISSAFASGRST